ncbi:Integrator complex subunit 11 [Saguinus oedipus]|uniref:Integrator complex subunit 11 n=1 Tax=Saguinus oedipus TaxID=9490 RepID=A0ABQ9V8N7_SAGOE|nr:Integrator complex subunit 11 [Saguinus oedipus]
MQPGCVPQVLIPVFALGRAQELCILLETFCCGHALAQRAQSSGCGGQPCPGCQWQLGTARCCPGGEVCDIPSVPLFVAPDPPPSSAATGLNGTQDAGTGSVVMMGDWAKPSLCMGCADEVMGVSRLSPALQCSPVATVLTGMVVPRERMNLKVPIYFSTGLTEKANHYYKLFIPWTNQKIRKTFVQRNMFEFKHIKAFDRAFADNPGPMVVFATPGMLHAGQSLQIFRKWAGNEKNMVRAMVIMPGYCVQGTVGHKILSGQRKLEMEGRQVLEVKMQVEYMSFSAHADAKGIMQLVGQAEPESVLLVHGEAKKMEFLKQKIEQELRVSCYMPANGETVTLPTSLSIPVGISLGLLKREMAQGLLPEAKKPRLLHGTLIMKDSNFRLVSSEQALKELGLAEHQLRFTCRVHLHDTRKEQETALRVYSHLKSILKDHCVQHLPDGSVTVESILIQATAPSEDPGTKVLLVSWTYQDEELGSFLTSLLKKGLPQAPS